MAAVPNDYDDGAVLKGMAESMQRFWHHCYGTDGQGGAVAAVSAAAHAVLHQLAAVPLGGGLESAAWADSLFKDQEDVSSALLVSTFLEQEAVVAPSSPQQGQAATPHVGAAAMVNDENQLACPKVGWCVGAGGQSRSPASACCSEAAQHCPLTSLPALSSNVPPQLQSGSPSAKAPHEERAPLRPSSQQDHRAPDAPHQGVPPDKLSTPSAEVAAAAEEDGGGGVARISIMPGSASKSNSRLVLQLGVAAACCDAEVEEAAAATVVQEVVEDAVALLAARITSSEGEDQEVLLEAEGACTVEEVRLGWVRGGGIGGAWG